MAKRWLVLLGGVALGAAIAAAGASWWLWPRRAGRPAAAWMAELHEAGPTRAAAVAEELAGLGKRGLEVLLEARASDDVRVHRPAAAALARRPAAAEELVGLLRKSGPRAQVILVRMGPDAVKPLIQALGVRGRTAQSACEALGAIGPEAVPALRALLVVAEDRVRMEEERAQAVVAIGHIGAAELDEDDRAALIALARAGPAVVRVSALGALCRDPAVRRGAMPLLLPILAEPDGPPAQALMSWVGPDTPPAAAAALARRVTEGGELRAALALARMGPAARPAVADLIAAMKDPKRAELVRRTLERLGPVAFPDLTEALADKALALEAAKALGPFGPRAVPAREALTRAMKDTTPALVYAAADAFIGIDPEAAGPAAEALTRLIGNEDRVISLQAMQRIGRLPPAVAKVAVPALIKETDAEDAPRAYVACVTLGSVGDPAALDVLRRALKREAVAAGAAEGLRGLGRAAKAAVPDLVALLDSPMLGGSAAIALLEVDPSQRDRAVAVLTRNLASMDEKTRADALAVLRLATEPPAEAVPLLVPMLEREDLQPLVLPLLDHYPDAALRPLARALVPLLRHRDANIAGAASVAFDRAAAEGRRLARSGSADDLLAAARLVRAGSAKLSAEDIDEVAKRAEGEKDRDRRDALLAVLAAAGASTESAAALAVRMTGDENATTRREAAAALAVAPGAEAVAALRECLWDPAAEVREAAAASLRKLAPEDETLLAAAKRDPDDEVRLAAKPDPALIRRLVPWVVPGWRLRLIGQLPDAGPLAAEVEADTRGQHGEDRLRAAAWLARHQPAKRAEAVALLTAALECWDPPARAEAARLLRELGEAKTALARHAERDPARAVRRTAR